MVNWELSDENTNIVASKCKSEGMFILMSSGEIFIEK